MDLIAAAICAFAVVLTLVRGPAYWRNEIGYDVDRPPAWFPLGLAVWRGVARIAPLALPLAIAGLPLLLAEHFGIEWLRYAAGLPVALVLALGYSVFFFNRPKRVVPPHLRHHPGAIREWLGADVELSEPPNKPLHRLGPRRHP